MRSHTLVVAHWHPRQATMRPAGSACATVAAPSGLGFNWGGRQEFISREGGGASLSFTSIIQNGSVCITNSSPLCRSYTNLQHGSAVLQSSKEGSRSIEHSPIIIPFHSLERLRPPGGTTGLVGHPWSQTELGGGRWQPSSPWGPAGCRRSQCKSHTLVHWHHMGDASCQALLLWPNVFGTQETLYMGPFLNIPLVQMVKSVFSGPSKWPSSCFRCGSWQLIRLPPAFAEACASVFKNDTLPDSASQIDLPISTTRRKMAIYCIFPQKCEVVTHQWGWTNVTCDWPIVLRVSYEVPLVLHPSVNSVSDS